MCGINGVTQQNRDLVERMNEATKHRGPDGSKIWESEDITLGHNRLSVIDLRSVADQPFVSDDGRFVTVFNGEIYNFKELRAELSQYTFTTEGDTEVLQNAYRAWGTECVTRLRGIFAFAIWDTAEKTLFLARDQFGVKPLYYAEHDGAFIFSSEIKAILESGIPRVLETTAFSHYMRLLYTPGEQTLFQGIKKLLPGHTLTVHGGVIEGAQYYAIPDGAAKSQSSYADLQRAVRERFDDSVEAQLVADVPLGVYLSGGIDSTAILDAVSRKRSSVDTFSIGFELDPGEESEKFNADYVLAQKTAEHYGARHHGYFLKSNDLVSLIEDSVFHMDEPVGNLTALAQLKLAEYAKKEVTVVLGGDGGDELFGGYKRHGLARRLLPYWSLPESLRRYAPQQLRKANVQSWSERYSLFLSQKDPVLKQVLKNVPENSTNTFFESMYFKDSTARTFLDDMMRADMDSWLVDESLLRSDKMSMAHGLEERVPFLDTELVSLARSIPTGYKTTFFETKKILKDALGRRLPEHVFNQPKRGWISPGAKWLRRPEVVEYVREILSPEYYSETKDLFRWDEIRRMYDAHLEKREYHLTPLWSVIVFQVWARRFSIQVK